MNFVTYFNYKYLPQAMCLITSIERYCPSANVFVFALDNDTARILNTLNYSSVTVLGLEDLMSVELHDARLNRTEREFFWTLTPFCILKVLSFPGVTDATYMDADMIFLKKPSKITDFKSSNTGKLVLTPHYFDEVHALNLEKHGYYCVQYMGFNSEIHFDILQFWKTLMVR